MEQLMMQPDGRIHGLDPCPGGPHGLRTCDLEDIHRYLKRGSSSGSSGCRGDVSSVGLLPNREATIAPSTNAVEQMATQDDKTEMEPSPSNDDYNEAANDRILEEQLEMVGARLEVTTLNDLDLLWISTRLKKNPR